MIPLDGIELIVVAFSLSKIGTVRALIFSLDLSESFSLDELELKNLRSDIEAELFSEFYNQNLKIKVLSLRCNIESSTLKFKV